METSSFDSVLVIDYGAQYAQLIARRVRECKVFSEILPHDVSIEEIRKRRPRGLILSGGPMSVYAPGAPAVNPAFFDLSIPVLGICYGLRGIDLLKNFLYEAADARPSWTRVSIIEEAIKEIREKVGGEQIICGLSGGVDSAVAAVLVHKAVGDQLTCVFVDHGLLRADEPEQVEETFRRLFNINLIHVKAQDRFLAKLAGVTDPELKRRAIGEEFIRVFEEVAHTELAGARFLVQGTLYPDIIESGTRDAAKIKSHHNVGGLPEDMDFELIEPLRNLFKDEVRAIGEELGLPDEIVWRQPFPGPGLAIRVIGDVTAEKLHILRQADAIVLDEVRKADLTRTLWQSFAILPDVRTVGVMGDERSYAHPIVVRAVTSEDAMTADWARLPYELLEKIASRIVAEVPGVNRVAYDIT